MGTQSPNRPSYPARPAGTPFAAPQSTTATPFSASGPVTGQTVSPFRPPPTPGFQHFSTPSVMSTGQVPPPPHPSFTNPIPFPSQLQPRPIPMGSPPQSRKTGQPNMNVPLPADQHSPFARPNAQLPQSSSRPAFPGYAKAQPDSVAQAPPMQPGNFPLQQGGFAPPAPPTPFQGQQRGYVPGPPITAPSGLYSGNQIHQHGLGPPTTTPQALAEDFSSLSLGSVPGSFDAGHDTGAFPRPLDGDVEPKCFAKLYPMNCSSRVLRLTTSAIPNSQSLASRWYLPLGAVVSPLAEAPAGAVVQEEVPIVNFAATGIIRCRRCRTYVNPYVTFVDNGTKWKCNICTLPNEVPGEYFSHLDATGRRVDLDQRPELTKGSVEFIAPAEYMVLPPMPPLYFFLIDVSISAIQNGMLESSLTQPQMMVVSDLDDIFIPLPDDLLVNLSESRDVIEAFLDSLRSMFQENMNVESAFGPALKAVFMIMSQLGGKLLIFQSSLPSLGVGSLRLRGDDIRVYGIDKEHTLRVPEDTFYKQMAADFTKYQIAVNLYAFSDKYIDIASLGTLAKYTGGQVYYYPSFQASIHRDKLRHELARDLTRETAWEAVMRKRCGKGVRFTTYHGNFMLRSTDLLALPAVDCDKAYAAQLSLEETLLATQTVYFQVALLYPFCKILHMKRRIRVHTAAAPVVADLGEMYRLADTGAIISVLSRLAIEKTLSSKLEDARNAVQVRIVKALREYRNLYGVQHRLSGRMIYPESLKFLPLYGLALCKSTPLRGVYSDVQLSERCASAFTMMALPVKNLLKLLYPDLVRLDDCLLKNEEYDISKRLPLTTESLDTRGLYIFDDGLQFVIWFGRSISPDIARNLLGEDLAADHLLNLGKRVSLKPRDNEMSRKLMKILEKIREGDQSYYQLVHLVRQGEQPRESFFLLTNLVEDQVSGVNGYGDWMIVDIHSNKLNSSCKANAVLQGTDIFSLTKDLKQRVVDAIEIRDEVHKILDARKKGYWW
ncbi:transport protein Sec24 [Striga asiatica]|uniref:Transport protein Sec24 n=1 Tax=Striga asiatica TaxID=4170 RepID=A0A5A7PA29_STRAF|nr:transport protein Sec24 [Striga asiatica]